MGKSRKRTKLRLDARPSGEVVIKDYSHSLKLLQERGSVHGRFIENALLSQGFKHEARMASKWLMLSVDQREALDMIFLKISRILSGDPSHLDHWVDIIGYATLITDKLKNQIIVSERKKADAAG